MRLQAGGVQRTGKPSGLKRVPYTVFSLHMEESNMKKMKRIISAALTLASTLVVPPCSPMVPNMEVRARIRAMTPGLG